jgi:RNA polymerase sigma factor (sigma-70 family)
MINMDTRNVSEELLDRAQKGDISAFQEIYAQARAFTFRAAVAYFGLREEDADDISQEVTWSLHRNLASVERPKAWLFAAVRNQVCRLRRQPAMEGLNAAEPAVDPPQEGDSGLWECILRLSERCRHLIVNLFFWGFTEREMSHQLGVHPVTVHQRKRKCTGYLFQIYEEDQHGHEVLPSRRDP